MVAFKAVTPKKARVAADEPLEKGVLRFLVSIGASYTTRPEFLTDIVDSTTEIIDTVGNKYESTQFGYLNIKTNVKDLKIKTYVIKSPEDKDDVVVLSEYDLKPYEIFAEYGQEGAKLSMGEDAKFVIGLTVTSNLRFLEVELVDDSVSKDEAKKFADFEFPTEKQREGGFMFTLFNKVEEDKRRKDAEQQMNEQIEKMMRDAAKQ
ncbi:hypothetical protein NCAS_0B07970 [Naumovozyma castellii]|uniref:Uncharacterized protein n=1 Tax=Naumovozyma castellii TaxID=27288 RepID=G0VAF1_NAUCA|nr:hypothetical protein NCAS_0B07970 [Naumovozyma castellii CBS 4309]CCC68881.1 hypothetical protein NCAS_0B07970 [Naumovozyma castellii CBS 4309]